MKIPTTPDPEAVTRMRQQYDREVYDLRKEIGDLRHQLAQDRAILAHCQLEREGGQMLLVIVDRYHRALRSLGYAPPEDEAAIVEKIRGDLQG